jgi:hypothetical protein
VNGGSGGSRHPPALGPFEHVHARRTSGALGRRLVAADRTLSGVPRRSNSSITGAGSGEESDTLSLGGDDVFVRENRDAIAAAGQAGERHYAEPSSACVYAPRSTGAAPSAASLPMSIAHPHSYAMHKT